MRAFTCIILLLSVLAAGRLFKDEEYLKEYAGTLATTSVSPASVPTPGEPATTLATTLASDWEILELRQAPGLAPVVAAPPVDPALIPKVDPVNPAIPALTTTSTVSSSPGINSPDFITVQWVETWIGGTSQTWVPKTVTFHFEPFLTQAPLPGKGEIGMGTLTGKVGVTQTVVMNSAPTQAVEWMRGVAVAVGVGAVGMV